MVGADKVAGEDMEWLVIPLEFCMFILYGIKGYLTEIESIMTKAYKYERHSELHRLKIFGISRP